MTRSAYGASEYVRKAGRNAPCGKSARRRRPGGSYETGHPGTAPVFDVTVGGLGPSPAG
jgi:hypothetical protein